MNNFNLNDFYSNMLEAFKDLELEFVDKEEYRNAAVMLEARKQLLHEQELNKILNGRNIIYTTPWSKRDYQRILNERS